MFAATSFALTLALCGAMVYALNASKSKKPKLI
jgi:hypothetical protein